MLDATMWSGLNGSVCTHDCIHVSGILESYRTLTHSRTHTQTQLGGKIHTHVHSNTAPSRIYSHYTKSVCVEIGISFVFVPHFFVHYLSYEHIHGMHNSLK